MLWGLRSDSNKYTTPGGHLEPGEKPLEGAIRELWEEAGIDNVDLEPLGSLNVGKYLVHGFKAIVPNNTKTTSKNDPDNEIKKWVWAPTYQNSVPDQIKENLHAPKNVLLKLMGMDDWNEEDLDKSENKGIVVCIPKSRIQQVEEEERQVASAIKQGHKPPTYYWTVNRLPKQQPKRIYFCWNGSIQAYHNVVGMVNQPDARILMDHRIHNIDPIKTDSFRGWRYFDNSTDMEKSEHDEVSQLLTNPDPKERAIALKLEGVRRHHLEYALSSNDPVLESIAAKHPGLDSNIVGSIFAEPLRYALKRSLLKRDDLTNDHLLTLLRGLQDNQTSTDPDKEALLSDLLNDPRCTTDLLQERWDYNRDGRVLRHPNCPIQVLEAILNTELETRVPLTDNGFAALRHPKCPIAKVSRAINMLEPNRCCAASANPDLNDQQIRDVLKTSARPDHNAYIEARQLCLSGWNVEKDHLDIALADPSIRVRCAVFKTPSLGLEQSHIDKALASNIPELIEAASQARIAPFNEANGGLLLVKSEENVNLFEDHAKRFVSKLEVTDKVAYRDVEGAAKGTIYVIEPHLTLQGTPFAPEDTWPNAELAAYAVYKAANLERLIVRCSLLKDKTGKDILVRELNANWQPIAQITTLKDRIWTTGIDTDIIMQEVARIAVLDYLLGNLYRHGHSLFWDNNSKRFIATDFGISCFQYKAAQSTAGLPKYGEKDSLLPYVIGDRTCIKDLNCGRWLGQAIGWIETYKEDILLALEPYWFKLGMEAKEEFLRRIKALAQHIE